MRTCSRSPHACAYFTGLLMTALLLEEICRKRARGGLRRSWGALEVRLERYKEACRLAAGYDAMVERERQGNHAAHRRLVLVHNRALGRAPSPDDRHLRRNH